MRINLKYEGKEKCDRSFPPTVRNVFIEKVNCKSALYGLQINGLEDEGDVYNINMNSCTFDKIFTKNLLFEGSYHNVTLNNVKMNGKIVQIE